MYDTIQIACTQCGEAIDFQTKAGPCMLLRYKYRMADPSVIGDVIPVRVLADLDGQQATCPKCEAVVILEAIVYINIHTYFKRSGDVSN